MATEKVTGDALPTLEWALSHPRLLSPSQWPAWLAELRIIDALLDSPEPPLAD